MQYSIKYENCIKIFQLFNSTIYNLIIEKSIQNLKSINFEPINILYNKYLSHIKE